MKHKSAPERRASAPRLHPTARWHRVLGIASTAIVVITTATGLLLNHSDSLALAHLHPESTFVDRLYGQQATAPSAGFPTTQGWVAQIGRRVYLGPRPLAEHDAPLAGAIAIDDMLVLAYRDLLVEYDQQLAVQETFGELDGVHPPLRRIGLRGRMLILDTDSGLLAFDSAAGTIGPAAAAPAPGWVGEAALPADLVAALGRDQRGDGVSYERLLLDVHAGRLFGRLGPWLVDGAAVCLLVLAVTGTYMWFKFKRTPPRPEHSPRRPRH